MGIHAHRGSVTGVTDFGGVHVCGYDAPETKMFPTAACYSPRTGQRVVNLRRGAWEAKASGGTPAYAGWRPCSGPN
eukprot:365499-Chlamydomonas_euryale.AAC.1